ncbi:MAG: DNA-protecting protein DprA [Ignavibacteria bacterium]|nr:DNA-protecting protein DprA [Ignavibacteria bacterium]MBK6417653.1 DNA-protecting protein DprA [Ignavibacteria bacterium]MBK6760684.1 DNA-protecting protein DprA [Ignavibacteria bacterium]MBK7186526.1 DNA-protecting protein DprA [Ignavibacteria bacterium]MBK7411161.1 DNA-protecting protein DprA [Ignavibacteria bacterium]
MELIDIIALSFAGRLTSAEVRDLACTHTTLNDALEAIGRHPMDLEEQAQRQHERCEELGISIIAFNDPRYLHRLRAIETHPALLYVKGALPPESDSSVGVVGTRSCTIHYGKPVTETFVEEWTRRGCTIVSGLANGIDMIAHETCLRHGGKTIAVIASGLDKITPIPANDLSDRIAQNSGCVISEHACGIKAQPPYFPARNRIISGLSDAIVVIESKKKGGALITADFASKQGKALYAVPGPINSTRSEGCNALIRSGQAQCLTTADDVSNDVNLSHNQEPLSNSCSIPGLDDGEPHLVDELAIRWQCTISEALSRLMALEMEGKVQQLPGQRYVGR